MKLFKDNKGRIITAFLDWLKEFLITILRDKAVKFALKKLLATSSIKLWIVQYVVKELFDEVAKPIIQAAFEYMGYKYEVLNGEHTLKKIENAETRDDWRDAARDV